MHVEFGDLLRVLGHENDEVHVFFCIRYDNYLGEVVGMRERERVLLDAQVLITAVDRRVQRPKAGLIGARGAHEL